MLKSIQFLEGKLATLLDYVRQLQLSNQQLRAQVEQLEQEKSDLRERMTQAQARIDTVIQQLNTETANPSDPDSEHP
ncbi:MAG: hypothetical protein H6R05_1298 [Burkholderiaceae bacterium]|nr:hypothetical protein [Burkholderiaceae bacterium]